MGPGRHQALGDLFMLDIFEGFIGGAAQCRLHRLARRLSNGRQDHARQGKSEKPDAHDASFLLGWAGFSPRMLRLRRWTADSRRMPLAKKSNNRGDHQAMGVNRHNSRANPAEGESRQKHCSCLAVPKPNVAARRYKATWAGKARLPANPAIFWDWHAACEDGR
jgi:hypothetical protein